MKLGISSYSFIRRIDDGSMDDAAILRTAKDLGYDAVEFADFAFRAPEGTDVLDYAKEVRAIADDVGITLSAYVMGADFAQNTKEGLYKEVDRVKSHLAIAHALGVPFFRHDVMSSYQKFRSFDQALPVIIEGVRAVTEYAQGLGIRTMTENHGLICQDYDRLERLVNGVGHENYGLLIDIGNFLCADADPAQSTSRLANLAFMAHVKDFHFTPFAKATEDTPGFQTRACNRLMGVAVGDGIVPVKQCIAILKRAGLDSFLDVEYEGSADCIEGAKKSAAFLKPLL